VIPVVDGHVDLISFLRHHFPMMPFSDITQGEITLKQLAKGHVRVLVSAFYCPDSENGPGTSTAFLSGLITYLRQYLDNLPILNSSKHLNRVMAGRGNPALILLLQNADALLEWDFLDLWCLGFRTIGLTHRGTNRIGDGNRVRNPNGLSFKGKQLLQRLYENGFIIDVSYLSKPAFNQVVQNFSGALIASHTGFRRFYDIPQNLSDEQIHIIIERGGIIGVTFVKEMLSSNRQAGIHELFVQIDWLVQRYGPDQVALGSDFGSNRERCDGLESPAQFQRLAEIFKEHGYPLKAIARIMGKNWSEFYALHLDRSRFLKWPHQ
jgi:membrane dipeptidase